MPWHLLEEKALEERQKVFSWGWRCWLCLVGLEVIQDVFIREETFPTTNLNDVQFIIPWFSRSKLPSKDIHHIIKHEENVR